MTTSRDICKLIQKVDPELGECGVDFNVHLDRKNNAWVIDYHQNGHHLRTFVENQEADDCINGNKCIPLGLQVGQLKYNFNKYIHEHSLVM
jgi:hypothetical protein